MAALCNQYSNPESLRRALCFGSQNSVVNLHRSLKNSHSFKLFGYRLKIIELEAVNTQLILNSTVIRGLGRTTRTGHFGCEALEHDFWTVLMQSYGDRLWVSQLSPATHNSYTYGKGQFLSPQNPTNSELIVLPGVLRTLLSVYKSCLVFRFAPEKSLSLNVTAGEQLNRLYLD